MGKAYLRSLAHSNKRIKSPLWSGIISTPHPEARKLLYREYHDDITMATLPHEASRSNLEVLRNHMKCITTYTDMPKSQH